MTAARAIDAPRRVPRDPALDEFAYAMGHTRTLGRDPQLQEVVDRADELKRRIAELERGA